MWCLTPLSTIFNSYHGDQFVLLVEETGVPRENHWPAVSHWQTLSHNVVSSTPRLSGFEITILVVMCTDCIGSYKSNYHTITTALIFNNTYNFFKKERKNWVIFFLCRVCDILVLIFLFWIALLLLGRYWVDYVELISAKVVKLCSV
jgi:hypothetical protein